MNNKEFVDKLLKIVNNYKTVYAYGTWGQIVTPSLIKGKAKQYPSWYTTTRKKNLEALVGKEYWCFDCSGLIKAVLWGWSGNKESKNGGAVYKSNGVPEQGEGGGPHPQPGLLFPRQSFGVRPAHRPARQRGIPF